MYDPIYFSNTIVLDMSKTIATQYGLIHNHKDLSIIPKINRSNLVIAPEINITENSLDDLNINYSEVLDGGTW